MAQWWTKARHPHNRLQALLTKWLLGWEIYYGDIPPWRRAMTLSEDDYQDSTATPETRKIWGEDKAKAVRPTVIMTPRSKPEVV